MEESSAKAYDTWDSQAVSDPSTNQAQRCLTCQIGRDGVCSAWYGRKRQSGLCHGTKSASFRWEIMTVRFYLLFWFHEKYRKASMHRLGRKSCRFIKIVGTWN